MPDELTREQLQFLATFLKPLSNQLKSKSKIGRKKKRKAHNDAVLAEIEGVKTAFSEWIAARDDVADMLDLIELNYDMAKIPEQAETLGNLRKEHAELVSEVRGAPADAPLFVSRTLVMNLLRAKVRVLDRAAQRATDLIVPPSPLALFDQSLDEIDAMLGFEDHATLTPSIAKSALEDQEKDRERIAKLEEHKAACTSTRQTVTDLRTEARTNAAALADLEKQARIAVLNLQKTRAPILGTLSQLVAAGAKLKLQGLSDSGDKVAGREMKREERLADDAAKITAALTAVDATITDLRTDLAEETGFQEKRAILAEISAKEEWRDGLEQRAAQMDAYRANAADHLERILTAESERASNEAAVNDIDTAAEDFDAKLLAWAQQRDPDAYELTELPENATEAAAAKADIQSKIDSTRGAVLSSREKIIVTTKLYPDEEDLAEISQPQCDTLVAMIDKAAALVQVDKFPEAQAMQMDAATLLQKFRSSRTFLLPELPEGSENLQKRIQGQLKDALVDIDRLWGLGADDTPLRTRHGDISKALATAAAQTPPDFRAVQADTDALVKQLALDLRAAHSAPPATEEARREKQRDDTAKAAAGQTASAIADSLLHLYRTEPVTEADLHGIAPNDLLIIDRDGVKEYHRIKLRDDDTMQRREDKKVPREAIDTLRQQMQMLETLQGTEAAGCAESVAAAAAKAEALRAEIDGGGDTYKLITDRLSAFDKIIKSSKLKEWHLTGVEALVASRNTFEKTYLTTMLPSEAAQHAQVLLADAQGLEIRADTVKTKHGEIEKVLDNVKNKLSAKPKKGDGGLGKVLADLIKNGPAAIPGETQMTVSEMMEADRLEAEIKDALDQIKELGQHGTGVQGAHRNALEDLRKKIDTKSQRSVYAAETPANALSAQVDADLAAIPKRVGDDPKDYLRQIASLVKGVAAASAEKADQKKKVEELKTSAKEAVAAVKTELDKAKNLSSYQEYKAIYDSLKSQYDNAIKAWDDGKGDPDAALSALRPTENNAKEILKELKDLTTVKVTGTGFDLEGAQTALIKNVEKVASAGVTAGATSLELAQQSEEQAADATLLHAIAKVQKKMELIDNLKEVPKFANGLQAEITAAVGEADLNKKRADMAKVREKVLKELRRINGRLKDDPALSVYRDNPFDHGSGWPQLRAALLNFETNALKGLNPGK